MLRAGSDAAGWQLAEPGSASTLAARVGLTRPKANYHLRALERHGLVELVEERRKGNCTERVLQATAAAYVISREHGQHPERRRFFLARDIDHAPRGEHPAAATRRLARDVDHARPPSKRIRPRPIRARQRTLTPGRAHLNTVRSRARPQAAKVAKRPKLDCPKQ